MHLEYIDLRMGERKMLAMGLIERRVFLLGLVVILLGALIGFGSKFDKKVLFNIYPWSETTNSNFLRLDEKTRATLTGTWVKCVRGTNHQRECVRNSKVGFDFSGDALGVLLVQEEYQGPKFFGRLRVDDKQLLLTFLFCEETFALNVVANEMSLLNKTKACFWAPKKPLHLRKL